MDQKLTDSLNAVAATWTTLALRQLNAERSEVVNAIYADPDADFCVVITSSTAPSSSKALTSAPASAPSCSGKTGAGSAPRLPLATRPVVRQFSRAPARRH